MPSTIINSSGIIESNDRALFETHFVFEAPELLTKTSQLILQSHFLFEAIGDFSFVDQAIFESGLVFEAFGFANHDPNVTDQIIFESQFLFWALNDGITIEALALFDSSFEFEAIGNVSVAETSIFSLIIDVLPPPTAISLTKDILQDAQFLVVGSGGSTSIPFVTATYSEEEGRAGSELSIQIARLSDKDTINSSTHIEFVVDGDTIFKTAVNAGVEKTAYNLAHQNNQPSDTFSFSSVSEMSRRFSTSPTRDLVLFDPVRQHLTVNDFEPFYDTNGVQYDTELVAVGGLSLYQLFDLILIGRCGFTSIKTNLPDFRIQRVDCSVGQSFMQSIAGYMGMFEPDIYEGDPGVLWIEDATNVLPNGFPAPRTINIDKYTVATRASEQKRVDALLVSYVQDTKNFDYTTSRSEVVFGEDTGTLGQADFTSTSRERFFIEYRRFAHPALVLASKLERETSTVRDYNGVVISDTNETYTYDEAGRITARNKRIRSLVPALPYALVEKAASDLATKVSEAAAATATAAANATPPVPATVAATAAAATAAALAATAALAEFTRVVNNPIYSLQESLIEVERFEYSPISFRMRELFLSKRTLDIRGITVYDPDPKQNQLGKNYKQNIIDSLRSGNVKYTFIPEYNVPVKSLIETATPNTDGTVTVKIFEVDHLTNVPSYSSNEDRAGDVGLQGLSSKQSKVLVFDGDISVPSLDRVESFSAGELPLDQAVALARRVLNKRKKKPYSINFTRIGYDRGVRKGAAVTVNERTVGGTLKSLGVYKVRGRSITVSKSGVFMNIIGKQL